MLTLEENSFVKLLEEIKSHSSKWIKTKESDFDNFYWQDGYGAFSINPSEVDTVVAYISNQKNIIEIKSYRRSIGPF